jgi:membrane protease YdiL (CAAX protease family)
MLFELLFVVIVTVAMPARAWLRYRRGEPPAPSGHYIAETLLLIGWLSFLLWRRNTPLDALGLSTNISLRWLLDFAICLTVIIAPDIWMVWRIERRGHAAALPAPQGLAADALRGRDSGPVFVVVTIVGAIWEELFFRGTIFTRAAQSFGGVAFSVVAGSLLFGLHHLRNGFSGVKLSMVFGVIFAVLFVITGNLWAVMLAHAAGNLLAAWQWGPRIERARQKSLRQTPMFLG